MYRDKKPLWSIINFMARYLILSCCIVMGPTLLNALAENQTDPYAAYVEQASTVLADYVREQQSWNHYFSHIAPSQSLREQVAPQKAYRHFLAAVLDSWQQITGVPSCQYTHTLYETALIAYSVAADFRLAFLYASSAILGSKTALALVEERAQHYTTVGDNAFQRATSAAQESHCVGTPTTP